MEEQGFEVFNPRVMSTRMQRHKPTVTERAYIPGYIFVRFDLGEDCWFPINWTRGIRNIMPLAAKPAPIADRVMAVMLDRCDLVRGSEGSKHYVREDEVDFALAGLRAGRFVSIIAGPLTGSTGRVTWTSQDRVKVLFEFLGATRPLDFAKQDVELVA